MMAGCFYVMLGVSTYFKYIVAQESIIRLKYLHCFILLIYNLAVFRSTTVNVGVKYDMHYIWKLPGKGICNVYLAKEWYNA
jgi:hypothetical protein